ncbi:hydantoinase B/oxoprolinase family protein [Acinetobacter pragensis]|uniref:Hydantoinase B/oxoprolinase domain-containing protein n=1 Tax=Acinetobacter pragensis TaxID=1806892 RepID=A0A151Y448_9GAMM|nr:hydantoinase B/oxoprolinase family protein [Acinetobacter pragensis]KYQ72737.1 hypothetical protein AZH43_07720 [Acinetobacter pragensis]
MSDINNTIDPITLTTTWHYFKRVCQEMRYTAERTATNVLVTTLHDLSYGIWDKHGRVIAIPEGFAPRLLAASTTISRVLEKFGDNIKEGDQFLTNLPSDGAVHLPDWTFVKPVFFNGNLEFFVCMGTHVADNGGAQPGSHFLAFDPIAEGLNIPLTKIAENNTLREDILNLLLANNRVPVLMQREIASLMGSNTVGERLLHKLLERYGVESTYACIEEMFARTEKAVRSRITEWPNGIYDGVSVTDDDGKTMGKTVQVKVQLTIKGDEATFDFSGSDDQVDGYINSFLHQTHSCTLCTSFLFLGTDLASYHNEGSLKPIKVVSRPRTLVSCDKKALTAAAPAVGGTMAVEAVMDAMSKALPDRAITPYGRVIAPILVGLPKDDQEMYVMTSFCPAAGAGAVSGNDGYQCAAETSVLGVVGKSDVEEEMARYPVRITRYEFRQDSHGAGQWRGAPGIVWEAINEGGMVITYGGAFNGFVTQANGAQGGGSTPLNTARYTHAGRTIEITEPHHPWHLFNGDHLICESGGGAGVGLPFERDPQAVFTDFENGLVSAAMAREAYGVVIDAAHAQVDTDATQKLRSN